MERYFQVVFYLGVSFDDKVVRKEDVEQGMEYLQNDGHFSKLIKEHLPASSDLVSSAFDVVDYPENTILSEDSDEVVSILEESNVENGNIGSSELEELEEEEEE